MLPLRELFYIVLNGFFGEVKEVFGGLEMHRGFEGKIQFTLMF